MRTSTKRGRPRLNREEHDKGTPELQQKRQTGMTAEPLDRCLRLGILNEDEHRAGMHLRWLYTLRFGAPTVRSVEFDRVAGAREHNPHDDNWRAQREQEYNTAMQGLVMLEAKRVVMDVCVFHRTPVFLLHEGKRGYVEQQRYKDGMVWLAKLWRR